MKNHNNKNFMMWYILFVVGGVPIVSAAAPPFKVEATDSIERELQALKKLEDARPEARRAALIDASYSKYFSKGSENIKKENNNDLKFTYLAAQIASFYTLKENYIRDARNNLDEMELRGIASKDDYIDMYKLYIKSRSLREARKFADIHADIAFEIIPDVTYPTPFQPGQPSYLSIESRHNKDTLELKKFAFSGTQIVVISHPLCHFSQNAASYIEHNPKLSALFSKHSTWLIPPGDYLGLDMVKQWNKSHPEIKMSLIYKRNDWPIFDSWATPTFYFIKDGKLIDKVKGWPPNGGEKELSDAMNKLDIKI